MRRIILLALCPLFLLTSCSFDPAIRKVEKYINIDLSSAEVLSEYETHGGMGNDGTTFITLQCNEDIASDIGASFRRLPLSGNVGIMLYGSDYVMYTQSGRTPLTYGNDDRPLFPEIENGYYYFIDLHSDASGEPFDAVKLLDRYSYNFVVAIYDSDTDILYYCKFDT